MEENRRPENMTRITTRELADEFIAEQVEKVRRQVGDKKVLLALSGGVDSSVVAALLIKAIGKQLISVHVNHGLMRKGESEAVVDIFRGKLDANLIYVDATERFLTLLAGVIGPFLSAQVVAEMNAIGGTILIGMALNMLDVTKTRIKVANMLPAIFLPIIYFPVYNWIAGLIG